MENQEDLHLQNEENIENGEENEFQIEKDGELYTIDINNEKNHVIFGGMNDLAEIYDYKEDLTVTRIEDFSDSVIYTKFIGKDRFIIVTANGTIALMEYEKDICIIDIEEDISIAKFTNKLVIGTMSGQVYLYDENLEHINTFGGHYTEILAIDFQEGRILSLCENFLTAHDEQGRCLYSLKATEATAFKYISSDVICFARDKKVQIFKENKKLFEIKTEESVETIEYLEKSLVIGGYFDYIQLIDTTGHFATFNLKVNTCVSLIKKYKDFQIIFATLDGLIGKMDIRNIKSLEFFSPEVGTIFDFAIGLDKVAVVGEGGYNMIDLLNTAPLDLTEN